MMFFRNFSLLVAFASLAVSSAEQESGDVANVANAANVHYDRVDIFLSPNAKKNDDAEQGHLRRKLSTLCTTSADSYTTGTGPSPNEGTTSFTASSWCQGHYSCDCGSGTTTCPYCTALNTGSGWIVCPTTGTTTTYTQFGYMNGLTNYCECNIYSDGTMAQNCTVQGNQTHSTTLGYVKGVGQPTTAPTVPPLVSKNSSMPLTSLGCKAQQAYNPRICSGSPEYCNSVWVNCNELNDYACTCSGSPDKTTCNYCQVQTPTEVICQVVGSYSKVMGLDGSEKTCTCEQAENGQTISKCM